MAQAAYKFVDRRSSANAYSSNLLIPAASQGKDRENIPRLDYDLHRNVSALGRRVLMSAGRRLFSGNSTVRAAIVEQATYSVSSFQPQYYGRNAWWGSQAEAWLESNDKFIDHRGPPYNMALMLRNLILGVLRDGDIGIILTEENGYPKLQMVPSHRIGPWNQYAQFYIQDGPYDGARCIDGVIVDDYGRAMAYRVMGENPFDAATFTDIPAASMILAFLPEYPDQVRGFSSVGASLFTWQDLAETEYHERMAHKRGSRVYLIEKNPTGTIDRTKQLLKDMASAPDSKQTATSLVQEVVDDGGVYYYKSGTGSGIEAFKNDRPSDAAMRFFERQTRQSLAGMGWSYDFTLDPSSVGGAPFRVIVEKVNRTIAALQSLVAEPFMQRTVGYRIAKAIKTGLLTEDVDWWKWSCQGPARLTADAKYDSEINLNENKAGVRTMRKIAAQQGEWWEDVQDQLIAEEKRLQEKCAAAGVDPERIRLTTPNKQTTPAGENPDEEAESETETPKEEK